MPHVYDILAERGFIAQCTEDEAAIRARLAQPVTAYIGFDPTADSFHVGSLVPIMGLYWLQQAGHRPLAVVGGATGLVGDPSGKTEMRQMLTREDVQANCRALAAQLGLVLRIGSGPGEAKLLDNADWLVPLNWIDLLRAVGPHFSVNRMLSMDSVKGRLASGGISFLEFNYMVMQAYDFLHLHRAEGCTLQMGGQDQWGNIVMGIELIRRVTDRSVAGLTFPLVTKADGTKFGKSEKGNVWLSPARTPVYDFYQFWRNVDDRDVIRFLGLFTTVPMPEVRALAAAGAARVNEAKELLAREVTRLIHGDAAAAQAQADARQAFASHDPTGASIPHAELTAAELAPGIGVVALLVRAGLATSTSEARRLIEAKGVRVGERVVAAVDAQVGPGDVQGTYLLLRAGKKRLFRFDIRAS